MLTMNPSVHSHFIDTLFERRIHLLFLQTEPAVREQYMEQIDPLHVRGHLKVMGFSQNQTEADCCAHLRIALAGAHLLKISSLFEGN